MAPITARSAALFRLGEQCNYRCPMCSNTGDPTLFFHPTPELLRRAELLKECGFRRVVLTGGEPTIHPGFWAVVEKLAGWEISWDINTHGRSFARPPFARRAVERGLKRAIVSVHSHDPAISAAMFGVSEENHAESVAGVAQLIAAGVRVMLNCVLSRLNVHDLDSYLSHFHRRFPGRVAFKLVFPSTTGKGGAWPAIATLRYDEVREPLRRVRSRAAELGARVFFESFPSCVLEDAEPLNFGRWAFGESHYLDDATGDRIYAMRHIEADLSVYGEVCRRCPALRRCPGIALAYARRWGVTELRALPAERRACDR